MSNSRLKELMEINPEKLTSKLQKELFNELKDSKLFLPVNFNSNDLNKQDTTITSDEPVTFDFITLKFNDNIILPLFTDEETLTVMGEVNAIYEKSPEIAKLLLENDNIDEIVINPNTDNSIGMSKESFVYNCLSDEFGDIFNIEEDLKEYAVPLEENTKFYLRSKTPFIAEKAQDGIFTANVPFKVSSQDVYHTEYPYLNVLVVPKGTMFLYLGKIIDDPITQSDVILAPSLKFKLMDKEDENTFIWQCIEQDFEDSNE